jgi:hypothetical protein
MSVEQVLQHLMNKELPQADRLAQQLTASGDVPTDELGAKRWEMTRELLGAAWSLPLPITSALARGIDLNNPAVAADDLKAFRKENADAATAAQKTLAEKAPSLAAYVPKALDAPPPPKPIGSPFPVAQYNYIEEPSYYRTGTGNGWRVGLPIGVIAIFLVKCAAFSARTSSYDHDYSYNNYNTEYDTQRLRELLDKQNYNYDTPTTYTPPVAKVPEVPERTSDDPDELYAQLYVSLSAYFYDGVATTEQQEVVEKLEAAVLDRDCKGMRKQIAALEKLPAGDLDKASYASAHTVAMRERINLVCPVKGAKKIVKKAPQADPAE